MVERTITVTSGGVALTGSVSQAKHWLLREVGTPEAIEKASRLDPPIVKVKLYPRRIAHSGKLKTTMTGDVHLVDDWVKATVGQSVSVGHCHYYGEHNCVHETMEVTMPKEYEQLERCYTPLMVCPSCKGAIDGRARPESENYPFLRGMVQRLPFVWWAPWRKQDYCAVICPHCKEIVGWEQPPHLDGYDPLAIDHCGCPPYRSVSHE